MAVVAVALLGVEVVGADDGSVGDHLTSCSHTLIADVVRYWASKASHQPACSAESGTRLHKHTAKSVNSVTQSARRAQTKA